MKQIVQNPKTGKLEMIEVPVPAVTAGHVLVRNHYSVVSPGTERMALEFARKSLLGKARSRPDLVKQVFNKVKQEGPLTTYRAVMNRLDVLQPLGYSCAGVVEAVGEGIGKFAPGDRVACAGAGYANHAEWVSVPENLVALVPENLPLEKAAFATVGAIALQGIRIAAPTLGEIAAVIGLGLIGQLAVQLLRANGCRVLAIDLDQGRVKQALDQGAEWGANPEEDHAAWLAFVSTGYGADLAIVTAASSGSEPVRLAADLCRMKGRIVVVGATAMDLDRRCLYEKELELRMSMSYGPGRYDRNYEERSLDYPLSYVRWTENRNLGAFLALAASHQIDPDKLATQVVAFSEAERSYEELSNGKTSSLAVIFEYAEAAKPSQTISLRSISRVSPGDVGVAFIGAGSYAKAMLLPGVNRCHGIRKLYIASATGVSAHHAAQKFGYANSTSDVSQILADPNVDLVFIATRHDSHAELAEAAMRSHKAVWVEKPTAINKQQLDSLETAILDSNSFFSVGFNRRFSPHAQAVKAAFSKRSGPMALHYTVAAGPPPTGTWHLDREVGGGRLIGEACHFVDLSVYLVGSTLSSVYSRMLSHEIEVDDSAIINLSFLDGSTATIEYLANTGPDVPKERWEVSADRKTARCENFKLTLLPNGKKLRTLNQNKGQQEAINAVIEAVRIGGVSPFPVDQILAVSRAVLECHASIESGRPIMFPKSPAPA
jgi:predicted dehydrogenase/threonine dehydrogenase-like Zn-dependent dehydrogenase